MRTLSGREACAILKKHAFEQVRTGTLISIIRQSGLDRSLFA